MVLFFLLGGGLREVNDFSLGEIFMWAKKKPSKQGITEPSQICFYM